MSYTWCLRENVYTALYNFDNNELNQTLDYVNISIDELINILKDKDTNITFVGDGVPKFREKLIANLPNISFAPTHLNLAKASSLGELGLKLLASGVTDDIYGAIPIYLRKPQAEREYEEKMRKTENE